MRLPDNVRRNTVSWRLAGTLVVATIAVASVATVATTHTTSTRALVNLSASTAAKSPASGEPPASFWGSTKSIPAAKQVLEVEIANRTNGHFKNSQVYWSFDGTEKSIAQQPYIDMPANASGRMYFYLGSKNSKYYDFIEFTVGSGSINLDTTRVDRFGLKLAILTRAHDGATQEIGEDYATFLQSRAATFRAFEKFVPAPFKQLATVNAPYGIPSPGNDPAFQAGGKDANYFTASAPAGVTTADVFGCGGSLSDNPPLCAALNRHVAEGNADPRDYYKAAPANYYSAFWHSVAINGKQYGFPYDDDEGQSSDISVTDPRYMIVAVGW
jgi:Beta-1,3-glucanase